VLRIGDVHLGSRILIFVHPGTRISDPGIRTPDPKTATKERDEKTCCPTSFCIHKNYFLFELAKKKVWANLQRIKELFTQKNVIKLSKITFGVPDPDP
jgi:hypothetical protein